MINKNKSNAYIKTINDIVQGARKARKNLLGAKSLKHHGYDYNFNWFDTIKSTAGIKIMYATYPKSLTTDSVLKWLPKLNIPEIIINRNLSFDRVAFCLAYELGCLYMYYGWMPHQSISKKCVPIMKKHHYMLNTLPCKDKKLSATFGVFALAFLNIL